MTSEEEFPRALLGRASGETRTWISRTVPRIGKTTTASSKFLQRARRKQRDVVIGVFDSLSLAWLAPI